MRVSQHKSMDVEMAPLTQAAALQASGTAMVSPSSKHTLTSMFPATEMPFAARQSVVLGASNSACAGIA
jgi:hypothetical protein